MLVCTMLVTFSSVHALLICDARCESGEWANTAAALAMHIYAHTHISQDATHTLR